MFKSKSKRIIAKVLSFVVCVSCAASVLSGCTRRIEEEPQVSETLPTQPSITTVPTTPEPVTTPATTLPPEPEPLEKYKEYYERNNEFVGWIQIPTIKHSNGDLYVDYPVVQAKDNQKYIDKDFDGKKSKSGAIYADYKIPITATNHADNITLFGHSMADKTFFRRVLDYKKGVDFVKENYVINFDTRWEENQYVVVACFLIGIYEWQDDEPLFEYF